MKKIGRFLFVFVAILLVAGCDTNDDNSNIAKTVSDDSVLNILKSHIVSLENSSTTLELYKKSSFKASDYSNDDILAIGLNTSLGLELDTDLTKTEKVELAKKGIKDVDVYITVNDVDSTINNIFGVVNMKYNDKVGSCPTYIYDKENGRYYVNKVCDNNSDKLISYMDKVTNKDNVYYVDVYSGIISNKKVYGSLDKSNSIDELGEEETYTIGKDNKEKFTLVKYTFTKNTDGKYVFTDAKVQ